MNTFKYNIRTYTPKQNGAALITMVMIMLVILMSSSVYLNSRMKTSTKLSGSERDNSEAFLYAESTMELLRGRFINNLDTQNSAVSGACDDGTGTSPDKCETGLIQQYIQNPIGNLVDNNLMPYMFYVTAAGINTIDQTTPMLLQRIADGEALKPNNAGAGINIVSNSVPIAVTTLNLNDLFDSGSPFLFTTNNNGLLIDSNAASWTALNTSVKSMAWIEVIRNPSDNQAIDLYVQAVAQSGNSKRYLQSYIGTYGAQTLGTSLAGLIEASNIDRR